MLKSDTLEKYINILVYTITNTADKDIKNIQGRLQFLNAQGAMIKSYPLDALKSLNGKVIKTNETFKLTSFFNHDPLSPRDRTIRGQLANLRPVWTATMIEFVDGTTLSL